MQLKTVSELMKDIIKEFNKDPKNWRVLRSKDSRNFLTTFIAHDDKLLWQMKTEWKNPVTPIGYGKCVKHNLNDEIQELMHEGSDLLIHEIYPNRENSIIAFGHGKYSEPSSNQLKRILLETPGYPKNLDKDLNLELEKILKKEQLLYHYL